MKTEITSESITRHQKLTDQSFHNSLLNFIGYLVAGTALWILMQWQFVFVFPNNADVLDEHLRFKDLWNVVMYVVPYCFWGMAIKNVSILVITKLNICYSEFQLYLLKRKLTK